MSRLIRYSLLAAFLPLAAAAQAPAAPASLSPFVLQDGTPLILTLQKTISSADAKANDDVPFAVKEEFDVNGIAVIAKGAAAMGTVLDAKQKGMMGKGGKLDVTLTYVRLVDGEKATLRASQQNQGGGSTGMKAGIVATAIIAWPLAPAFLLMHGKDIEIRQGMQITAFLDGDMKLEQAKFQVAASPVAPEAAPPNTSNVQITSNPAGADIEVDQKFIGSTPATVNLPNGDHTIVVKKDGFADYTRTLSVIGSPVHIDAALKPNL